MEKIKLTKEEINFIVEKYKDNTRGQVVELFKEKFDKTITQNMIMNCVRVYGDYKKDRRKFKNEHLEYFKEIYKEHTIKECSELLKKKFDVDFSVSSLRSATHTYHILSGRDTRFKKGQKMTSEMYEKCKNTMFKKGKKPFNAYPIGHEISYKGYIYVKIKDDLFTNPHDWFKNWKAKSRIIYEQNFGPIPDGYQVIFADGNNRNFEPDNLILASNRELCYMNHAKLYIRDEQKLNKQTINIAKLKLKIYDKKRS